MTTPTVTRLKLPAVRRAIQDSPWAIVPGKLRTILDVVEAHAAHGGFSPAQIAERVAGPRKPVAKGASGIQVLSLYGVIAQRMDWMSEYSGGTSCLGFSDQFDAAMADPDIAAIVIDCDSPGGNVSGVPELAKRICDARGQGKQIIAVANSLMASAAYWICSAADEIVVTPSGEVGSIGVFAVHEDDSEAFAEMGIKFSIIRAGDHKAEGNPYEPLSADAQAYMQSQVDEFYGMFTSSVAKQRGVKASVVNAQYGQGRTLLAKPALAAGMVDRIDTLEGVLRKLGAKNIGASGRPVKAATGAPDRRAGSDAPPEAPDPDNVAPDNDTPFCPECGAPMDTDDDTCDACGYTPPDNSDAQAAGAAGASLINAPDHRPHQAKELHVPGTETAPAGANTQAAVDAALAADRTRSSEIRAVGRHHKITEEEIDRMVNSGMSYEAATAQILKVIGDRRAGAPIISVGADREAEKPFASVGDQMQAMIRLKRRGISDRRLIRVNRNALQLDSTYAAELLASGPDGMSEGIGSDGGFFLAPELLPGVIEPIYNDDPILSKVFRVPISTTTNSVEYNIVDEKSRANGSRWGGIAMGWGNEADLIAASKAKMRRFKLLLKKLTGAAFFTDELLEDTTAAQKLIGDAFQAETQFMLAEALWSGPGGGQPLGFMSNAAALGSQAIEGGQSIANSSQYFSLNLTKMLTHIPGGLWSRVIWLYQQELLPYLMNATITVGGSAAPIPVFVPMGGFTERPFDMILGRPAYVSEQASAVGTPGDIVCVVPDQIHVGERGGVQVATSIHFKFLNDETTLRTTYRVDAAPVWSTTVTPFKGAVPRTFVCTLAART